MPSVPPLLSPFAALRPAPGRAPEVVARPYDVITFDEAKAGAAGKPWSFLHVSRAEIDLPEGTNPYADAVYERAAAVLFEMYDARVLRRDPGPAFYVYRMTMGDHVQTGLAGAASVDAYRAGRVRKHELTRPDKEDDRTRQIETCGAQTGLVLCAHHPNPRVDGILAAATAEEPDSDAVTDDGVRHQVWVIADLTRIEQLWAAFDAMDAIYIADGHHRSAAAARVADNRRAAGISTGDERFLVVTFPADQMKVLDYNRVVRDLAGMDATSFLAALAATYDVEPLAGATAPDARATFTMVLEGRWYRLRRRAGVPAELPPADRLDVSLLAQDVLGPLLGITDLRTDRRIDFVGGGRGLGALEERVASGEWAVAFALYPTALDDVMAVADAGAIMPPKSTWFEPKLADGLLSLVLD